MGNRVRVKVVKNKMAPPFVECEFDVIFGKGISRSGDILDLGSELGFVEKSGAWYSCQGERIGQGRDNARTYFEAHPEMMAWVQDQILEKHNLKKGAVAVPKEEPAEEKLNGASDRRPRARA